MKKARAVLAALMIVAVGMAGQARAADEVYVERRSTTGTVLRNTVSGALLGSAVAGGVILYEMGIEDNSDYDWGRTLAWGAAIGLGVGLVWGIVDATTGPSHASVATPVRDGNSLTLDLRRKDQSRTEVLPVFGRRF